VPVGGVTKNDFGQAAGCVPSGLECRWRVKIVGVGAIGAVSGMAEDSPNTRIVGLAKA